MRKENSSPHYNKTPSWDGAAFFYKSEKTKKDNLAGRVPIQIKGTEKVIVSDTAAFSCSIADLKNYYKDGGCIFSLISVDLSSGNSRIFYKTLLVVDLDKIIKGAGKQKTRAIPYKSAREPGERFFVRKRWKTAGILCVFQGFPNEFLAEKIRQNPQTHLCGVALAQFT